MRALAILLLAAVLVVQPAAGQEQSQSQSSKTTEPAPYEKEEFPPFLRALGRFETIFVGSLPFTIFFSGIGYDVGRWAVLSGSDSAEAALYAPLFFAPPNKPANTAEENLVVVLTGVGISMVIALVDQLLDSGKGVEY